MLVRLPYKGSIMICPKCKQKLTRFSAVYSCPSGHSFDIAKEGYANLLLANKKNSQFPGDNKEMVASRVAFLNKGYYLPLADAVARVILDMGKRQINVLDAGCGVGYYSKHLKNFLKDKVNIIGIDISKFAVAKAAKSDKESSYFVGSIFDLPIEDKSQDVILNIFSPRSPDEFKRVLSDDGIIIQVLPGKKHLIELKEALYGRDTYENEIEFSYDGFALKDKHFVSSKICLGNEDLMNVFSMTPYLYKTKVEDIEKLKKIDKIELTIDFVVAIWGK